jgi:hypothetical protein
MTLSCPFLSSNSSNLKALKTLEDNVAITVPDKKNHLELFPSG